MLEGIRCPVSVILVRWSTCIRPPYRAPHLTSFAGRNGVNSQRAVFAELHPRAVV